LKVADTPIRVFVEDGISVITIDSPNTRNALTPQMLCLLADAVIEISLNSTIKAAVITGSGEKAFCSGGDLARTLPLMSGAREAEDEWDRRLLCDPKVLAASGLRDYPLNKPIVAAINGACMAAGFELMLGTDIRICAEHAVFGLPEVKHGLIPFAGSMARLPRQIPYAVAMEILLTGEPIPASEAHRIGLVNQVCPAQDVLSAAIAIARKIASNGPLAVQTVKHTVTNSSGLTLADAYQCEDQAKNLVMASQDAREGPLAFMEKRRPVYSGR
jgi:enoyl-CoA hydratase